VTVTGSTHFNGPLWSWDLVPSGREETMSNTTRLAAILFTFTLCVAATGRADVIFPAPTDCPPGSVGDSHHGGPHCAADLCTDDPARCAAGGAACQEHGLCTDEQQGASRGGPFTFKVVVGTCDPEGQCAKGKCEKLKVCVPPTEPKAVELPAEPVTPAGDETTGTEEEVERPGCHLGQTGGDKTGIVVLMVLVAGGLFLRRR
jgi:hypothetical protein